MSTSAKQATENAGSPSAKNLTVGAPCRFRLGWLGLGIFNTPADERPRLRGVPLSVGSPPDLVRCISWFLTSGKRSAAGAGTPTQNRVQEVKNRFGLDLTRAGRKAISKGEIMIALARRFYNNTARLENMILLASVLGELDSMPDVMEDDFLQEDVALMESCFGPMPDEVKEAYEGEDYNEFIGWLLDSDRFGFLLKFATPVMKPTASGNGASFSWRYYYTQWVYGDTLETALERGFAWVAEQRKNEKVKTCF